MKYITLDKLNDYVEFDTPFRVASTGNAEVVTFDDDLAGVWAPSCYTEDGELILDSRDSWESYSDGYSGQDSYTGPIMHESEYLGGSLARDMVQEGGVYCVCAVYVADEGDENGDTPISGWVVCKLEESEE